MVTLTLQTAAAVLKMVFVAIAIGIVRQTRDDPSPLAAGWRWVAVALLVSGVAGLLQSFWAVAAVLAGPTADTYQLYLDWLPAMNYSSFAIAILLAVALTLTGYSPGRWAAPGIGWLAAVLLVGSVGVVGGRLEGSFDPGLHLTRVAALQTVETVALLGALFVTVLRRSLDTWLWLCLFVYACRQAANALVWSAFAWVAVPGGWHPPYWVGPAIGVGMWLIIIGLATRRLVLALRGAQPGAIFAPPIHEGDVRVLPSAGGHSADP